MTGNSVLSWTTDNELESSLDYEKELANAIKTDCPYCDLCIGDLCFGLYNGPGTLDMPGCFIGHPEIF